MYDAKDIIKKVKKIEIKTRKLVEGLLQGAYHSVFKGRGIEFSEIREYQIGDDIRTIDWNVTAKMGALYVKQFVEERDLTVYIVFDVSASNEFGFKKEKKETAIELAASLIFAAMRNNDRVGLILFTNKVERFIPPRKGKRHAFKLIRELVYYQPEERGTDLGVALEYLSKIVRKRSVIFIISDFFTRDFSRPIKIMKGKHDIVAFNIFDIREREIPDVGYIFLEDQETGEQILVNTSDENFRKEYSRLAKEYENSLEKKFKNLGIDFIRLGDELIEVTLRKFFKMRIKRLVR